MPRHHARPTLPWLALSLVMCACGASDPAFDGDGNGSTPDALHGGQADSAHPAVGLVWTETGGRVALCTGTLIAPDLVLTAAHCAMAPVEAFYLGAGKPSLALTDPGFLQGRQRHAVDGQAVAPDWHGDCRSQDSDLAVLHLADPVDGVTPLLLGDLPPAPGDRCQAVGFGWHTAGDGERTVGEKRAGTEIVTELRPGRVVTRAESLVVEHGDSGGPLLCDGKVVGAASCANVDHETALYSRVDLAVGRILEAGTLLRGGRR